MMGVATASLTVVGRPRLGDGATTVVELHNEPSIVAGEVAFGMGSSLRERLPGTSVVTLAEGMPMPVLASGDVVVSVRDCHLHPWQAHAVALLREAHPELVVVDHGATASEDVLGSRAIIARDALTIASIAAADILLERAVEGVGAH